MAVNRVYVYSPVGVILICLGTHFITWAEKLRTEHLSDIKVPTLIVQVNGILLAVKKKCRR